MNSFSEIEWHPATVSRRGNRYYVVMTVPEVAREALGGKRQLRVSAGTTDPNIAAKRRYELEGQLRAQVLETVRKARLKETESQYAKAIQDLRIGDRASMETQPA